MDNLDKIISSLFNSNFNFNDVEYALEARNAELDDDDLLNNVEYNMFRAKSKENKITAPEMAYTAIHDKQPMKRLYHSNYQEKKIWNNLLIDKYINEDILDNISKLNNVISIRAVSQGHSKERPTYIVIRLPYKTEDFNKFILTIKKLQNADPSKIYKLKYDVGNLGYYRLCIAGATYFDIKPDKLNTRYHEWWSGLYMFLSKGLN